MLFINQQIKINQYSNAGEDFQFSPSNTVLTVFSCFRPHAVFSAFDVWFPT